jgi:hypothetical protein
MKKRVNGPQMMRISKMASRTKLSRSGSRKLFEATARRSHKLNRPRPMRGGTRL